MISLLFIALFSIAFSEKQELEEAVSGDCVPGGRDSGKCDMTKSATEWDSCHKCKRGSRGDARFPPDHRLCCSAEDYFLYSSGCECFSAPSTNTEGETQVADPHSASQEVTRDCYSFDKNCDRCRGYLDSCCSDKNCGGNRKCKAGRDSYSCVTWVSPQKYEKLQRLTKKEKYDTFAGSSISGETQVADPHWATQEVTRDCYSFEKNCNGCRGYLDSCCSDKNCGGNRYCKRGRWSYSCDTRSSEETESMLTMADKPTHHFSFFTYGFAALGFGTLMYGAGKHYFGKTDECEELV